MISHISQPHDSSLHGNCPSQFGHARCPHCRKSFNLKDATPTFLERLPRQDVFVYVLCTDCHTDYQIGTEQKQKAMNDKCFINFKVQGLLTTKNENSFAVTSLLTLALNDGCLTAAIENGHGLTSSEYFSLCEQMREVNAPSINSYTGTEGDGQ